MNTNAELPEPVIRLNLPPDLRAAFTVERLPYRRSMNADELTWLQSAASAALHTEISRELIENIVHFCLHVERRMEGRAAGHVEDLALRYLLRLVASAGAHGADADHADACHMEIGALFGAATVYSCHATRLAGRAIRTVVIDPFAGYYDHSRDPVSGAPVSEEVFWSNLRRFGFDRSDVTVLRGLSADPGVLARCRGMKVLSLLIDADHSYEGIKRDWMNYSDLVVPGGYVLIDDYNSSAWPDVTRFVNREILPYLAGRWSPILMFSHSLILKRIDRDIGESMDASLVHRFEGARHTIEVQDKRIRLLQREIESMRRSRSWRVTAPLRRLRRALLRTLRD